MEHTMKMEKNEKNEKNEDFSSPRSHLTIEEAKNSRLANIFFKMRLSPWSPFRVAIERLSPEAQKSLYDEIKKEFGINVKTITQAIYAMAENDDRHIIISCVSDDVLQSIEEEGIFRLPYKVRYVGYEGTGFRNEPGFQGVRIKLSPEHLYLANNIRDSYRSPDPSEIKNGKLNSVYTPHISTSSTPFTLFWKLAVEQGAVEIYGVGGKKLGRHSLVEWSVLF